MEDRNQPIRGPGEVPRFDLPLYQGPLDLLLHLIKRAELDPRDVAASIITEQYLAHLELMEQLNLDIAGEYLVMAATLLLIKSFALLPHPEAADTVELEELQRGLVERLLEFQRYREAAAKLAERDILGRDVFAARGEPSPEPDQGAPPWRVSVFDLVNAMSEVLKRLRHHSPHEITLRDIPVALCLPRIIDALVSGVRVPFDSLFTDLEHRNVIIATFMALLELIRRRAVCALQDSHQGPIYLVRGEQFDTALEPPEEA